MGKDELTSKTVLIVAIAKVFPIVVVHFAADVVAVTVVKALKARRARPDRLAHRVLKARLVHKVHKAQPAHRVRLALRVPKFPPAVAVVSS